MKVLTPVARFLTLYVNEGVSDFGYFLTGTIHVLVISIPYIVIYYGLINTRGVFRFATVQSTDQDYHVAQVFVGSSTYGLE